MICKLCDKDKELKKSHIIPEFVYKQLYDEKGRFHVLSTLEQRPRPLEQKGIREKLLCNECEQQLSIYEKYAREIILGGESFIVRQHGNLLHLSDINYHKFKLFLLSILWRSSISSHIMFSRVNLGPHEKIIKELIKNNNPGTQLDYPCVIFGLNSKENIHVNLIDQPRRFRTESHMTYRFIFSGFVWVYYVSSHKLPSLISSVAINKFGSMVIGRGSFDELSEFRHFAVELHNMGRFNKPKKNG